MAIPRRFYILFTFSVFAVLSTYFFLNRAELRHSLHSKLGDGWGTGTGDGEKGAELMHGGKEKEEYDENGFRKTPEVNVVKSKPTLPSATVVEIISTTASTSVVSVPEATDNTKTEGSQEEGKEEELRIAITESGGSHDEVSAALIHAFGVQPDSKLSLYLLLKRFGISNIIDAFKLASPITTNKSSLDFVKAMKNNPAETHPQILVLTTCELALVRLKVGLDILLENRKTFLFCVIHHADRWIKGELVEKVEPWVDAQMIHFITLSAHTARFFRMEALANWPYNATVLVNDLPPVFPVQIPEVTASDNIIKILAPEPLSFALQGDYDPSRRNYTSTFEGLGDVVQKAGTRESQSLNSTTAKDVTLHLVGHGKKPKVPDEIVKHVAFDEGLDFLSFYTLLSRTFTLLPSFASADYLDRKASSSVPAALIAGTPLVATQEILQAYSYVPADAAWIQDPGESEMDVVMRVVGWSDDEHQQKKAVVREARERLIQRNTELVADWIHNGMMKVDKEGWGRKNRASSPKMED